MICILFEYLHWICFAKDICTTINCQEHFQTLGLLSPISRDCKFVYFYLNICTESAFSKISGEQSIVRNTSTHLVYSLQSQLLVSLCIFIWIYLHWICFSKDLCTTINCQEHFHTLGQQNQSLLFIWRTTSSLVLCPNGVLLLEMASVSHASQYHLPILLLSPKMMVRMNLLPIHLYMQVLMVLLILLLPSILLLVCWMMLLLPPPILLLPKMVRILLLPSILLLVCWMMFLLLLPMPHLLQILLLILLLLRVKKVIQVIGNGWSPSQLG